MIKSNESIKSNTQKTVAWIIYNKVRLLFLSVSLNACQLLKMILFRKLIQLKVN